MNVKFKRFKCVAIGHKYNNNGEKAIELIDQEDHDSVAFATVNMPQEHLMNDEVFIKDYSENKGMVEALVEAGIIEEEPIRSAVSGFVTINAYKLTKEAMNLWQ